MANTVKVTLDEIAPYIPIVDRIHGPAKKLMRPVRSVLNWKTNSPACGRLPTTTSFPVMSANLMKKSTGLWKNWTKSTQAAPPEPKTTSLVHGIVPGTKPCTRD